MEQRELAALHFVGKRPFEFVAIFFQWLANWYCFKVAEVDATANTRKCWFILNSHGFSVMNEIDTNEPIRSSNYKLKFEFTVESKINFK